MLDDDGVCSAMVSGTVPSCIGQTSVASEWCAAAVVAQLAVGDVDGAQDCKAVVNEWAKPLAQRLRPSSVHAGQSRELLAHESASHVSLRWIKGHVEEDAATGDDAQRDARGNGIAETLANEGRARHSEPPMWLTGKVAREAADAQAVILHAAKILYLWPRVSKDELRAARPQGSGRRRCRRSADRPHEWVSHGGVWQCRQCLSAAFSSDALRRRSTEECPGDARALKRVVAECHGHNLMVADVDGGPCLFCAACGAWCTSKPRNLKDQCRGRSGRAAGGLAALKRFRAGYVPDCGESKDTRVHALEPLVAVGC